MVNPNSSAPLVPTIKITEQDLIVTLLSSVQRADALPDTTEGDNERLNILADICNEVEQYGRTKTIKPISVKSARKISVAAEAERSSGRS